MAERRHPAEVMVWFCGHSGCAMEVSSNSDEEFDWPGKCACGAEFAKAKYRLVNPVEDGETDAG